MRNEILSALEKNSKIDTKELAVLLGKNEVDIINEITKMEEEGTFLTAERLDLIEKLESQIDSLSKIVSALEYRDMYNDIYKGYINCKKNPDYKNKYDHILTI